MDMIDLPRGHYMGYGFTSKEEAMDTVDEDYPDLGQQYLISGQVCTLERINGKLEFVK